MPGCRLPIAWSELLDLADEGKTAWRMDSRSAGCRFLDAGREMIRSGLAAMRWLEGLNPAPRPSGSKVSLRGPMTSSPGLQAQSVMRKNAPCSLEGQDTGLCPGIIAAGNRLPSIWPNPYGKSDMVFAFVSGKLQLGRSVFFLSTNARQSILWM